MTQQPIKSNPQEFSKEAISHAKRVIALGWTKETDVNVIAGTWDAGYTFGQIDAASKQVGVGNVWQLCPKCQGQGQVSKPPGMPVEVQEWASTEISFMCDVCNGTKIIAPPVQQVGNVWVKASERLPVKGKPVPLKFWGLYGSGRSVGYYIVDDHNGTLKNEEVEWLDESGSLAEENRRLRDAANELLHLHSCEQEGLQSGKPTFEMWFNAVNKLSEALDGDAGNKDQ